MPENSILLIGPMGVGKTCVAKALSEALGLPYVDSDALRWAYFARQPDYDGQKVEALFEASRGTDAFRYMKPFEARFTVHLLENGEDRVIDFGAGYSVYEDEVLFEWVRSAFAKYRHVLLLRYSKGEAESLAVLRERHPDVPPALYEALNRVFIESPCNALLATHTIDTKDKTIQEVVALALEMIGKAG